jgi:hypothetical protein
MQSSFEVTEGGYRLRDGIYDDWDSDCGLQQLSAFGTSVLVVARGPASDAVSQPRSDSDERIHVRQRPLSSRAREDKLVALIIYSTSRTMRVKVELTIVDNNTRCVAALWQTTPEHGDISKSQVSSEASYVDICHNISHHVYGNILPALVEKSCVVAFDIPTQQPMVMRMRVL